MKYFLYTWAIVLLSSASLFALGTVYRNGVEEGIKLCSPHTWSKDGR